MKGNPNEEYFRRYDEYLDRLEKEHQYRRNNYLFTGKGNVKLDIEKRDDWILKDKSHPRYLEALKRKLDRQRRQKVQQSNRDKVDKMHSSKLWQRKTRHKKLNNLTRNRKHLSKLLKENQKKN